jgi:hypothetical protein
MPRTATVRSECFEEGAWSNAARWTAVLGGGEPIVVLWTPSSGIGGLAALATHPATARIRHIYLSSTLTGRAREQLPAALAARTRLLHSLVAPDAVAATAWRALTWLKSVRVQPPDTEVAVNTLFAALLTGDALSHPGVLGSREYFVEQVEHMTGRSPTPSAYAALTLSPSRRHASTACAILSVPVPPDTGYRKVFEWVAPAPPVSSY